MNSSDAEKKEFAKNNAGILVKGGSGQLDKMEGQFLVVPTGIKLDGLTYHNVHPTLFAKGKANSVQLPVAYTVPEARETITTAGANPADPDKIENNLVGYVGNPIIGDYDAIKKE